MDDELLQIAVEFGETFSNEEYVNKRVTIAYRILKKLEQNPVKLLRYIEEVSSIEEFDQYLDEV